MMPLLRRALRVGEFRAVDQPLDDARVDVFAEGVADLRLDPELADHRVEGVSQSADFVGRGDRDHGVEHPLLDRGCAGEQVDHSVLLGH